MSQLRQPLGLVMVLFLSVLLGWQASRLPYRYAVADLFPSGEPSLAYYDSLRTAFPGRGASLALGIHTETGIFRPAFLRVLDSLSQDLARLPGVERVASLTQGRFLRLGPLGTRRDLPLVHPYQPDRLARDSAWLMAMPPFRYTFLSPDARTTCLYLRLTPGESRAGFAALLTEIDHLLRRYALQETAYTGGSYSTYQQEARLRQDMWRMGAFSLLWILGMLWLAFRRWWGLALPLLIIGLSTVWTLGLMQLLGGALNLMTILLPALLFVVGTSDVIHLLMHYREALGRGLRPAEAVVHTRRTVGLALLLTSCTTALGFLMLRVSASGPVGDLGLYTALGVMIAYVLTLTLLPPLLPWLPVATARLHSRRQQAWHRLWRHRHALRAGALGLALLALPGLARLEVQAFFGQELRPHTPLAQEIAFFERYLGGTRPFLLGVSATSPDANLWTPEMIRALARVEDHLVTTYGLHRPYSLVRELRATHSSLHQGRPAAYGLPAQDAELANLIAYYRLYTDSTQQRDLITPDGRLSRIAGTLPDLGLQEMARRHARFQAYLDAHPLPPGLKLRLSGEAELLDRSHRLFVERLGGSLLVALVAIAVLMGFLFRSWRMALLALLPNVMPLLLIAGGMGLAGVGLNMSTAIIFTISFGIAVDDSIHFLSRLYLERRSGKPLPLAIRRTWFATGRAMIWTTAVLVGGFLALLGSSFWGTWLTGLLVSLTLLLALGGDLVLLPVLLLGRKRSLREARQRGSGRRRSWR